MRLWLLVLAVLPLAACAHYEPGAATGETCTSDGDCPDGQCVTATDDPRVRYCTEVCAGDGYCPAPMQCIASMCRHPFPSPGSLGASCTGAGDCLDNICYVTTGADAGVCTVACPADGCPRAYECRQTPSGDDYCLRPVSTDGDGCAGGGAGATPWLLAVAVLVLRRRLRPS